MLLGLSFGCREERKETRTTRLSLRYLPACAPRSLDAFTVEALGDFSSVSNTLVSFDPAQGVGTLDGFPADAHVFRVSLVTADFRGAALVVLAEERARPVELMLPLATACEVSGFDARALEGAAWSVAENGALFFVGGEYADGEASAGVVRIRVDEGSQTEMADTLFVARAGAAAVAVGSEIWVLGGAQSLRAGTPGLSNLERIDVHGTTSQVGRLRAPRVGGHALRLLDGSVLLVGGARSVDGVPLQSLERIEPGAERAEELAVTLPWRSAVRAALLREDGLVLLAGQVGAEPMLALFDPVTTEMQSLKGPAGPWSPELMLTLPGARIAFFELRDGATTGVLWLLLPDGHYERVSDWLAPFAGLSSARAVALSDGRALLTGRTVDGPTARIIDPGRTDVRLRSIPWVPGALLRRNDGSILGVSDAGVWILREDARTAYDNPAGTLLADDTADRSVLAFSTPSNFQREGLGLVASKDDARFDLAGLRYEGVRVDMQVVGASELLMRNALGEEYAVRLGQSRMGLASCQVDGNPEQPVSVRRSGADLTITTSSDARVCTLSGLEGAVSLAYRALKAGAHLADLRVTRE